MRKQLIELDDAVLYAAMRDETLTRATRLACRNALIERNGDETQTDSLIRQVVRKATRAGRIKSTQRADAMGACRLALVEAAEELLTKEVAEPVAYLTQSMRNAVARESEATIRVPAGTALRLAARGHTASTPGIAETAPHTVMDPRSDAVTTRDELWEELMACCQTDNEREVIKGFAEYETVESMMNRLDCGRSALYLWRDNVRRRYEERNDVAFDRKKHSVTLTKTITANSEDSLNVAA